ncbi:MAG: septal ring lytic transglycosylase RlpA family protein [Solirubrobacterales bacterium]
MMSRALTLTGSISPAWRLPAGALPLAAATLVLIAVPIARATGTDTATSTAGGATAQELSPVASEAARKPKIHGSVLRSRSVAGSAITVQARVTGVGKGKSRVRLSVRASGSKKWRVVSTDSVRGGKKFKLKWRGGSAGRYMTRVSVRKFGRSASDRTGRVYVFRKSHASYYGPGLYGGGLACGGTLTPSTVGVAHKTLPCGTRVTFKVGNRLVTAPVVDRGPFIAGRDWDLTTALRNKLRFGDVGAVYATK